MEQTALTAEQQEAAEYEAQRAAKGIRSGRVTTVKEEAPVEVKSEKEKVKSEPEEQPKRGLFGRGKK